MVAELDATVGVLLPKSTLFPRATSSFPPSAAKPPLVSVMLVLAPSNLIKCQ